MFFSRNFFDILKVNDHIFLKEKILNKIDEFDNKSYVNNAKLSSIVSKTDWDGSGHKFLWLTYCFSEKDLNRIGKFIYEKYKKTCIYSNSWFSQYYANSNSNHNLHKHPECDLVLIYYVELYNKKLRTNLVNPKTNKIVIPNVKEGDLLIIPSNIMHSSPKNNTNTRKTIISINIHLST